MSAVKSEFFSGDLFCVEPIKGDRYLEDTFLCLSVEILRPGVMNIYGAKLEKDPVLKTMTLPFEAAVVVCFNQVNWNFFDYQGDFKLVRATRPEKEEEEYEDFD